MSADADLEADEVDGDPIGLVRQLELDELQELVTDLVQENEELRDRVEELESTVEKTNKRIEFITEDLVEVEKQAQSTVPLTRLEQMLVLSPEERRRELSASERRALDIIEHWDDLAEPLKRRDMTGVTTTKSSRRKYNPSAIKATLEDAEGGELYWEQIYRAMRRAAELSGGEYHVDVDDRGHVTGGFLEYHEKVAPGGDNRYRVLLCREPKALTPLLEGSCDSPLEGS